MKSQRIMALDVGLKRTGVAFATRGIHGAPRALGHIPVNNGHHNWQTLDDFVQEWQPDHIIIGATSEHDPALKKARNRVVAYLQQQHRISPQLVDETLSTVAANQWMHDYAVSHSQRGNLRDAIAACIILETWLDANPPD